MPICDGFTATKRIRDLESELPPGRPVPASQRLLGRIPIVAVSASLLEKQHIELLDGGSKLNDTSSDPANFLCSGRLDAETNQL
jgi:CheY-like chemotaxis protein